MLKRSAHLSKNNGRNLGSAKRSLPKSYILPTRQSASGKRGEACPIYHRSSDDISGKPRPVSHLLTALSVIYSFSASSFWLSPSSCRCSLINEPTFLAFIFLTSCFEYNSFCLICHPTLRRIDDFRRKVRKKFIQTRNFFRRSRGDHRSPCFINIYKKPPVFD